MSFTSLLFKTARLAATGRAVRRAATTGSVKPVVRRAKNIAIGRLGARSGFWRWLWK